MQVKNSQFLSGLTMLVAAALTACVSVPEQFRGAYPDLAPNKVSSADIGQSIRWGGMILATRPDMETTCFEILSRTLANTMRPKDADQTLGRFIACRDGFLDPEVFARGREVTLTGWIERLDTRKVGEFDYQYPIVSAEFISMWPERQNVIIYEYDRFYSPWYWRYPYYHPYPPMRPYSTTRSKGPRIDVPPGTGAGRTIDTEG